MEEQESRKSATPDATQTGAHENELALSRARMQAAVDRLRDEVLRELQECDEEIRVEQAKRGILERLFGYHTQTPGF